MSENPQARRAPSSRRLASSKVNILSRYRSADDPELIEAKREHAVAAIEDSIQKIVDAAPPLGPEQIERLRSIFRAATAAAVGQRT